MSEKWIVLILVLAILYIISPVDVVPDVIPVVGWADDLAVGVGAPDPSLVQKPE